MQLTYLYKRFCYCEILHSDILYCCAYCTGESSFHIQTAESTFALKTEAADSSITEHPHDDQPMPYLCAVCDKRFTTRSLLRRHGNIHRHMTDHTADKPFICHMCDKAFSSSCHLNAHMGFHTGEKPHKCRMCDKAFVWSSQLYRHMRIHTGEKPYKCQVCDKAFSQSSHLKIHMGFHTGEQPHKCHMCDKAFFLV